MHTTLITWSGLVLALVLALVRELLGENPLAPANAFAYLPRMTETFQAAGDLFPMTWADS